MQEPTDSIIGYMVEKTADGWRARRRSPVSDEQRAHGIREEITADTFEELQLECVAQRIRASWYR